MKRSSVAAVLCFTVLMGTAAWSAPSRGAPSTAVISEIMVYRDEGGHGIGSGGAQGWTLRSNGTAEYTASSTVREQMFAGAEGIPKASGTFDKSEFGELLWYLQSSRLFDLKPPPVPGDMGPTLEISMVRGGKRKSFLVADSAPSSAASLAAWVTYTLVRGITAETDWKDPAGNSIDTGLRGRFIRTAEGLTPEVSGRVATPVFSVLNAAGKEVGTLEVHNEPGVFRLVLPPGTYQVVLKTPGRTDRFSQLPPDGYAWRALPSTVQVLVGSMTPVSIGLQKTPAAQ